MLGRYAPSRGEGWGVRCEEHFAPDIFAPTPHPSTLTPQRRRRV